MLPKGPKSSKKVPVFEANAGLYVLFLRLHWPAAVRVGALGVIDFAPGAYVYSGSACKNLLQRISRHFKPDKRLHWHIDYLTTQEAFAVKAVQVYPLTEMTECDLNMKIQQLDRAEPIPEFGCSDCSCRSHLTFFRELPAANNRWEH